MGKDTGLPGLFLRVGVGLAFLASGLAHFWPLVGSSERFGAAGVVHAAGLNPAETWISVFSAVEALLGLCLIAGLFTRIAVFPPAFLVLYALVTRAAGEVIPRSPATLDKVVYLSALLALFFCGSGILSLDRAMARRKADEAVDRA